MNTASVILINSTNLRNLDIWALISIPKAFEFPNLSSTERLRSLSMFRFMVSSRSFITFVSDWALAISLSMGSNLAYIPSSKPISRNCSNTMLFFIILMLTISAKMPIMRNMISGMITRISNWISPLRNSMMGVPDELIKNNEASNRHTEPILSSVEKVPFV